VGQAAVTGFFALTAALLVPTEADAATRTAVGAAAASGGLLAFVAMVFLYNLVAAPLRQRNEARAEVRRLSEHRGLVDVLAIQPAELRASRVTGDGRRLVFNCTNTSDTDVNGVHVRVESLEWWGDQEEKWHPASEFSAGLLAWASADGGGASMSIGAHAARRCDLAFVDRPHESHVRLAFADATLREAVKLWFYPHRARCRFEAPNYLPVDVEVTFEWGSSKSDVIYMGIDNNRLSLRDWKLQGPCRSTPPAPAQSPG